ncbi:carbohydrate-binding protein [Corynebacterium ureicelerivorans]
MTLQDTIQALPDQEFRDLKAWIVTTETDRRAAQPAVEQARAEDTQKLWEAHPELKPAFKTEEDVPQSGGALTLDDLLARYDQWVQPLGAHDALPTGAIVAHKRRIWRTDLPTLNVWEPGTPNTMWVDITDMLLTQANQQAQPEETDAPEEPEPEPEPEGTGVQEWAPGINVTPGQRYTFQGDTYEVIQGHTSASHWPPNAVPALYKKV